MNFLEIVEDFLPWKFFIGILVFSLKGLENHQNRIFSKKTDFFKKFNFEDFQALLEKKLKSYENNFWGRNAQNYPKT